VAEETFSMRVRQLAGPFTVTKPSDEALAVYNQIVQRTVRAFAADGAVLRVYEPEFQTLVVEAAEGEIDRALLRDRRPGEGICGKVFADTKHCWCMLDLGQRIRVHGAEIDAKDDLSRLRDAGLESVIVMRLESETVDADDDRLIGTLSYFLRRPHHFSFRDVALFRSFCQRSADTIALQRQNAILVERERFLRVQSQMMTRVELVSLIYLTRSQTALLRVTGN
jgi:GAF domain-containing protein